MNEHFPFLKKYAEFILKYHLDTLIESTIRKAREKKLPILKFLSHLSEEELFQLSKTGFADEILIPLAEEKPFEKIRESIIKWKADTILIPKEQLDIIDITSINNVRKLAMLDLLNIYDYSKEEGIFLMKELVAYFTISINLALEAYEEIQRGELKEKNEILSGILSNIPVIVTRVDKAGNVIQSLGSGLKLLGLENNNLKGTNVFGTYPDANNTRKAIDGTPVDFVGTANTKTGETRHYQSYFFPELNGALGFSIDITETFSAQAALTQKQEELTKLNAELEEKVKARTLQLEKQKEYIYSVLMQAPAAIAILKGPSLIYELSTPLYYKLVGKNDLIGKPGREAIPELTSQGVWDVLENVYKTGKPFYGNEFPAMMAHNDNGIPEEGYFNFVATPLKSPEGIIDGIMIHATEVTEQLLATKKAEENARWFSGVLEAIPPMAWTASSNGELNYFSQRWFDYTGQNREEAIGSGWEKVLHPDDVNSALEGWEHSLKAGTMVQMENRFRRASDGQYRWHLVRGVPLKNTSGEITLWVGTCTDIHDIKNFTKTLQDNENQLRLITNNIPAYIAYVDKEETYIFANTYYNFKGFVDGPIEGKKTKEVLGENYNQSKPNIDKVLKGELVTYESAIVLKDNSTKKLEVKYVPDKDEHGNVQGFVVMGVDLTERIEFEKRLKRKNVDLTRINSDLDNFIYTASHDLKAPVSNIEGLIITLCETLKERNRTDSEIDGIINMINASIKRFQNTIQDLTEISKTQKNINEEQEEIDIKQIFEETKKTIEKQIRETKAIIDADFECSTFRFSKLNFKSLIFNLLTNAIKYNSPQRKPHIKVICKEINDWYILEVKDNGLGIKNENKDKIFGMFKRMHDHVEGSGVGLYLVKRIVDNAEGKIEVESTENVGSVFRIYLPKKNMKALSNEKGG
jgi:PAS domain S-box-containing protein